MEARRAGWLIALSVGYVLVSSWFGLNGTPVLLGDADGQLGFFVDVWTDSLLADAVFVGGTILAGLACLVLLRLGNLLASVVGGFLAHWLVYALSYVSLDRMQHPEISALGESFLFVADWGWPGLLVASLSPAFCVWWMHRQGLTDPLAGHEIEFG